ncbi:hypothetical protein ACWCQ1_21425 [Streptomyces sp. NPDC002144]|uniref:hypothetical protein n=1 Tax=Streptomyces sp. NPDC006668 TaxID=3156903 RepID=UPI0033D4743D
MRKAAEAVAPARRAFPRAVGARPAPAHGPDGCAPLLASVFVPKKESPPGAGGELVYWRELAD